MAVFRVERNSGYTVMSNHHLRNKELTLKAKGLLSQMLSLPEDWDYTLAGLYFEQTLSKEDYAKLDKLNDHFADCQTMQTEEHFKYGLSMGVLLMKEIYELSDFK